MISPTVSSDVSPFHCCTASAVFPLITNNNFQWSYDKRVVDELFVIILIQTRTESEIFAVRVNGHHWTLLDGGKHMGASMKFEPWLNYNHSLTSAHFLVLFSSLPSFQWHFPSAQMEPSISDLFPISFLTFGKKTMEVRVEFWLNSGGQWLHCLDVRMSTIDSTPNNVRSISL